MQIMRGLRATAAVVVLCLFVGSASEASPRTAKRTGATAASAVRDFSSPHFLIHTDLPPKEAQQLLRQLEAELNLIAAYWGRAPSGIIECCVANDFSTWPESLVSQMEPNGVAKIREGAGVCIGNVRSSGKRFTAKCRIYSVAKDKQGSSVPLHEAVHGYCQQTFGRTGPRWYAEGMAELGHYWIDNKKGVHVPDVVINYLRKNKPRPIDELIVTTKTTGGSWQDYCWWWFLCHLLENNPNYTKEFRVLGIELLSGKDVAFSQVFGPRNKELTFEYDLFLKHLQSGYRVDLCSWEWNRKFFGLTMPGRTVSAVVLAARGWQPSGAIVVGGSKYAYSTTGTWRIHGAAEPADADGTPDGNGRLVGVVMTDYSLGEEFELGESGTFTAPADGNLYLRCRVAWNEIANNSGRVTVKLKLNSADASLKQEKQP
jgi:hypothetical protein